MKRVYILTIIVVLILTGCSAPQEEARLFDNNLELIGTWFNYKTDTYCIFREDGTFSWGVGDVGAEIFSYTIDGINITIENEGFEEHYTYRIEYGKLYLSDNIYETEYVRIDRTE